MHYVLFCAAINTHRDGGVARDGVMVSSHLSKASTGGFLGGLFLFLFLNKSGMQKST